MPSSFALLLPHSTVRQNPNLARMTRPSAMAGAAILCTAILLAALGTVDPLWWHLHFSRLGTFADLSGYTFNGGVILSGLVIAAGGVPLAVHLANGLASGRIADARAARALPPLLVALGLCLALIGVIPLTLNEFLHDRAANGVLLSFLGLVVVSRRTLRELPAFVGRYAIATVIVLVVGITMMFLGLINLAAFEVLAFGGVLSWVHLLERSVRRLDATAPGVAADVDAAVATAESSVPAGAMSAPAAHLVRRGTRARVATTTRRHTLAAVGSVTRVRDDGERVAARVAVGVTAERLAAVAAGHRTMRASAQHAPASTHHAPASTQASLAACRSGLTGPRRSSGYTPRALRAPSPASRG